MLSKLTSRIVSPVAIFCRLLAHWGAGLSVCRLVGGQQEWVLCVGQGMLESLIGGNWKWALRIHWLVFSSCAMKGCRNHVLDSVVLNMQGNGSLVDALQCKKGGVQHAFTHKRRCAHSNNFSFALSFCRWWQRAAALRCFNQIWQHLMRWLLEDVNWMAQYCHCFCMSVFLLLSGFKNLFHPLIDFLWHCSICAS